MWIDAHNHLQDAALGESAMELESLSDTVAVANGTSEADWARVRTLAERCSWVVPAFGLHPWFIEQRSSDWKIRLQDYLSLPGASVGEIGLDRQIENVNVAVQEEIFRWQLDLAAERNIPVSIHCVKAFGRLADILRSSPWPQNGFLLHSYSGSIEMGRELAAMGAYFSYSTRFLEKRHFARRDVFRQLPLDRILAETDAAAHVWNPEAVITCYRSLADTREIDVDALSVVVQTNFKRLFGDSTGTRS